MDTANLPVLDLEGTPRERGRAHGETLRASIRELRAKYRDYVRAYYDLDPAEFYAGFRRYADFLPAVRAHASHLLEEAIGIAEGAGLDPDDVVYTQFGDEEWQYGFFHHEPAHPRQKCSSFGIVGEGTTYGGQNMDIPPMFDGHQILMRIREPDGHVALVFSFAGMIGLNGVNNARLGLCCNSLNQLQPSHTGLPVAFIVRCLLEARSFVEAEAFLRAVPHASGQNYLLSAPGRVGSFECSALSVTECSGGAENGRICHTNHVLASADLDAFQARVAMLPGSERPTFNNSRQRLLSIGRRVEQGGASTLETLRAALSAHDDPANPVSRTHRDVLGSPIGFTAGSMIYELGSPPRLHVAAGPPCETPWRTFDVQ